MILSKLMIPIYRPAQQLKAVTAQADYFFHEQTYTTFLLDGYTILHDCHHQWYLVVDYVCSDLQQLKETRQILRPFYLQDAELPTVELLEQLQLTVDSPNFDKAYGHALYFDATITNVPFTQQLRLANYDGADDPQVTSTVHYIENRYDEQITHFVAGVETNSFATITESDYYAQTIWPNEVGLLYLKLFVYFKRYGTCPSEQMMAKLLCNLWQSTTSLTTQFNINLYKIGNL